MIQRRLKMRKKTPDWDSVIELENAARRATVNAKLINQKSVMKISALRMDE